MIFLKSYIKGALALCALTASATLTWAQKPADISWIDFNLNDKKEVYENPESSPRQRAVDLVERMTFAEKVSQLIDKAAPISRLGVPEYNWWNECLHGVARNGKATSFPQAIGLAATWNTDLILEVAEVISTEARAKHHKNLSEGKTGRYQGLTMWTPNINIFRDPRWGRGQETYGEDPYLTSRMGVAFVKGLQGEGRDYLKVVATPKHFAVHSGPEPDRHHFDAYCNPKDLWETYLPAFEATVKEGKAFSVMSAYNRYLGESATASPFLLQEILRDKWGFEGYVVSDCGAVDDIHRRHKLVPTAEEASAMALKSGCDLNCGSLYANLVKAKERGLVNERDVDTALVRLFEARFRLGMFDPQDRFVAEYPYQLVESEEHRKLARKTAQESIVLLKNKGNTLPLKKNLPKIAVLGPNADDDIYQLGNYNGMPEHRVTVLDGIRNHVGPKTEVFYSVATGLSSTETEGALDEKQLNEIRTADAIVFVGGISPRLEGEEMKVNVEGFNMGDRTNMKMPEAQLQTLKKLKATGKPVILVLTSGSAMSINWCEENLDGIMQAWYPGQEGGNAVADVLFGDYNPSGKLPVTFYKSVKDLPPFEDYHMDGRTYRYFHKEPLYPFGYGKSYTQFGYAKPKAKSKIKAGDQLEVSVQIKNTGQRDGQEVVQLYVKDLEASVAVPLKSLRKFRKAHLKKGESRTVNFTLAPKDFELIDRDGEPRLEKGKFEIIVGTDSASENKTEVEIK
ncbi:glycosyl hydrolase [Fulvitalea axinellae]|uniref:Glycosyl hydrolase n=1 Tax=Fulvitalea axinellae TaxID=1182444 RepID=A0AAU9CN24_9BACT|nr:glycosyl hydrolase [Fulvitalea axinellae]